MNFVDKNQQKTLQTLAVILAGLGGIVAVLTYLNSRNHRKLLESNAKLDQEIKALQLEALKNGRSSTLPV